MKNTKIEGFKADVSGGAILGQPEAAEDAVADLTKMVQKLTSANFSNIMITADHGFLYQHRPLDESSFSVAEPIGDEVLVKNRRFVVGRGLKETAGLKLWKADQLGLGGDLNTAIPNSVNRLRLSGSGSRFVHGGASLQEIVVPVSVKPARPVRVVAGFSAFRRAP